MSIKNKGAVNLDILFDQMGLTNVIAKGKVYGAREYEATDVFGDKLIIRIDDLGNDKTI